MSFTFEFALQVWTSKLEGLTNYEYTWHEIVMNGPAAVLPYFLRFANHYRNADAGLVALTALVNIGAIHKDRILEGLQEFNFSGHEHFESQLICRLMDLEGPRGPYLLADIKGARLAKHGPVWTVLKKRALKRWSTVLFMVAVKRLWYAFMARICHPDSGYFRRVLVRRFYKNNFPEHWPVLK